MKECLMGIDVGGTSIKVMVCSARLELLTLARVSSLPAYKEINGNRKITGPQRNLDADKLWELTVQAVKNALSNLDGACRIKSLSVSCFGCTNILIDSSGRQVDLVADHAEIKKEVEYYRAHYSETEFSRITGYPMEESTTGFMLSAFFQKNTKDGIRVFSADDYLVYRLTGVYSRNFSTALSCGMWDTQKESWLDVFVRRTGLEAGNLGEPIDSGTPVAAVSAESSRITGLSPETLVCSGGHDYECAAFACHEFLDNSLMNITGTIDILSSFSKSQSAGSLAGVRHISDYHVIPGYTSLMVETFGAIQLEWYRNLIAPARDEGAASWDGIFEECRLSYEKKIHGTELFIPKVFGEIFPHVNTQAFGAFIGISSRSNTVDLLRAVLEGLVFMTRKMLGFLGNKNIDKIVLLGGASRDAVWNQLKADILNVEVVVPSFVEASALGAAMLAGCGIGYFENFEQAARVASLAGCTTYYPEVKRSEYYDKIYHEIWLPFEKVNRHYDKIRLDIHSRDDWRSL